MSRRLAVLMLSLGSLAGPAAAEGPRFPVRQVLPGAPIPADGGVPRRIADRVANSWDREQIREDVEEGYALDALENGVPPSDGSLPQVQPPSRPLAVPGVPEILPRRLAPVAPANVDAPMTGPADGGRPLMEPPSGPLAPSTGGDGDDLDQGPPQTDAGEPPADAPALAAEPDEAGDDPDAPSLAGSDETEIMPRQPAPIAPADVGPRYQPSGLGGAEAEPKAAVVGEADAAAGERATPPPPAPATETVASPPAAEPTDEPSATANADDAPPAAGSAPAAAADALADADEETVADAPAEAPSEAAAVEAAPTAPTADGVAEIAPEGADTPTDAAAAGHATPDAVTEPETAEDVERGDAIAPPISTETRRDAAEETATDAAVGTPPAEDPADTPVRLVRTLQLLQDQIARGSTSALKGQRALLSRIENRFASAGPQTWQTPANAYALVTFVLSGGNPATLRDVLGRTPLPPIDENLMRGALAYVDGREKEAATFLAGIEPLEVPASMGAQLALARAALAVRDDTTLAIALLDSARLLAPGTLAEEAALRREIFVVSQIGDVDKFEILATQYLMRFRHSVYAGNFRQRFAAALTRMDFIDDPNEFGRLDSMISDLDLESRLEIYLLVARAAVNRGLTNASTMASERGLSLAEEGSVAASRARLYRAAALVVTPQGLAAGIEDLDAIDPGTLPPDDAALHQAAASTAKLILTAPDLPETAALQAETAGAEAPAQPDETPMPEVATRAQDALAAVDELLKRSSR